jgi:presenilin-like A22 family membrane protease
MPEVIFIHLRNRGKVFFLEAFLFCLTLLLGIATAFQIDEIFKFQQIQPIQISFWNFVLDFLFSTLFIFLIVRFLKFKRGKRAIFKILFILSVFFGGLIFLEVWLPEPIPLIFLSLSIFWWLKKPSVLNQDILMILGIVGTGSILGLSLKPEFIILLLIIFSIYDFIAVYKTKHMVKMAKEMIEERAILAFIIPLNIPGFKENLEKVQFPAESGERKFLILGGGDVAFPLIFSSSLIPLGISKSLIVALFSLIGLFANFLFFFKQKERKPIPALPPIALFSITGYLLTLIIR